MRNGIAFLAFKKGGGENDESKFLILFHSGHEQEQKFKALTSLADCSQKSINR
jgi:hypothetical protein